MPYFLLFKWTCSRRSSDDQARAPPPQRAIHARINARALEKIRTLSADGYILDLEDAVAPDAKDIARPLGYARRSRPVASDRANW